MRPCGNRWFFRNQGAHTWAPMSPPAGVVLRNSLLGCRARNVNRTHPNSTSTVAIACAQSPALSGRRTSRDTRGSRPVAACSSARSVATWRSVPVVTPAPACRWGDVRGLLAVRGGELEDLRQGHGVALALPPPGAAVAAAAHRQLVLADHDVD